MGSEDFTNLKESIKNGFDETLGKITLFDGFILDGWNRYRACQEMSIQPIFETFSGNEQEAFEFSIRANQDRRHLTKSQLATIAIEAEPMWHAIQENVEKERRRKIAEARAKQEEEKREQERLEAIRKQEAIRRENERIKQEQALQERLKQQADEAERKKIQAEKLRIEQERENERLKEIERVKKENETVPLVAPSGLEENKTRTKLASTFGVGRQYIQDAKKLKESNPEAFEAVKRGDKTITEVKKEIKQVQLEEKKQEILKQQRDGLAGIKPTVYLKDCKEYLNTLQNDSVDLLITDPPYSTDIEDINAFAEDWVNLALSKVKKGGRAYICIGAYPKEVNAYLNVLLKQDKFIVDNPLIWTYRNTLGITPKMKYNLNYQMILHLYSEESKELDTGITNEMFSVQDINAPDGRQANRYHTWQKPDELANRLIRHSTKEGDKIIDCFACTGTFLIAGAKLNRIAEGCDNSHDNLMIAKERGCNYEV